MGLFKQTEESIFLKRLHPQTHRVERLEQLQQYYLHYLVEDPVDGTRFDSEFLDWIEAQKKKYKDDKGER
jgi:hypothetical protein